MVEGKDFIDVLKIEDIFNLKIETLYIWETFKIFIHILQEALTNFLIS